MTIVNTLRSCKTITIIALTGLLFLASCTPKISFLNSAVVPSAEGSVKVKTDNNKNHNISLHLIRLAEPDRLTPPKRVYVVWMETTDNGTKNLGQLRTSGSTFSKAMTSSFETVTAFKPTKIFITAEDDATVQYPGSVTVLTTPAF